MSGDTSYDPTPLYVLNLKFIVEGILTPTIGSIGIIGIKTTMNYCQSQGQGQAKQGYRDLQIRS